MAALINKAKMYQDELQVVGIMTVKVISKIDNAFKCGISIKIKPKTYLGILKVHLTQKKLDDSERFLQRKEFDLGESDTEANFNAVLSLREVRDSKSIHLRYTFNGSPATGQRLLYNDIRLPITVLKFLSTLAGLSSTSFQYFWKKLAESGDATLIVSNIGQGDQSMFNSCFDLSYYFENLVLLGPDRDFKDTCGLIYQDCHQETIAFVKICLKDSLRFEVFLLCAKKHAEMAKDICKSIYLALAAVK